MSDSDPLVSIVVLSWNRCEELRRTLVEIGRQDYASYEVIVVDNGSRDGSPDLVRLEFPHVRLIDLPENIGIEGLNVGLRAARGEIAVLLDDDSYPLPDALGQLVRIFEKDPQLGIAAGQVFGAAGWTGLRGEPADRSDVPTFLGCGVGIRLAALHRSGDFDGSFFLYQNELDLAVRVTHAGYRVRYFADVKFVHAVSPANRTNYRKVFFDTRNVLRIIWKYFPPSEAQRLVARVASTSVGYRLVRGDLRGVWTVMKASWAARAFISPHRGQHILPQDTRQHLRAYLDAWFPPPFAWVLSRARRRQTNVYAQERPASSTTGGRVERP